MKNIVDGQNFTMRLPNAVRVKLSNLARLTNEPESTHGCRAMISYLESIEKSGGYHIRVSILTKSGEPLSLASPLSGPLLSAGKHRVRRGGKQLRRRAALPLSAPSAITLSK